MDPEQTFIRVQERFSQMLTPKVRVTLEYLYLFIAITLFCILVVMHANYVQQPGCSGELSGVLTSEAQLIQIKITSAGLWYHNDSESNIIDPPETKAAKDEMEVSDVNQDESTLFLGSMYLWNWIGSGARRGKLAFKFWKTDTEFLEHQAETSTSNQNSRPLVEDAVIKIDKEEPQSSFTLSAKETLKAAIIHFGKKWYRRISFIWRHTMQIIGSFQKLWDIAGVHLNLDIPKWMHILHLDKVNSNAVQWLKKKTKLSEPTYLYTMEKGYFLLPESAKSHHNICTVNVSISAWHSCFGNRWQQLLINRFVGYDTILINSLLSSPGQGYLYNYQSKEFYNLSFALEVPEVPAKFGDYLVTKCGVLMMSLFVFFTTTMSVSFTLRETQTRMLKFTVQLQHHARHRLPTFQLIFVHVIESLVFVPIMIGILFFLFEFYDDQLLAFMVLILVWLCELFTLISVRTPISMKFFPRFFLLYFLVFHIYFFSYAYGFSYLALSTTAAFMQHLILYFWNRFE
ncbi:membralin, partial [Trifolium pratense]